MPTPKYTVRCLRNRQIARGTWEFVLEKPEGFFFKPGQFVLFDVALIDNPADVQTRAFSIASSPNEKELLFVAKMKDGGRASRWIAEVLREGTAVPFQGPFGNFTFRETGRPVLFVATSTGIAPFRSMIRQLQATRSTGSGQASYRLQAQIIFGIRGEEDIFWLDELGVPRENIHLTISQPSDAWKGKRGRVQGLIPQVVPDIASRDVYVCGNPDMTKELKKLCLETWGVPKAQLHVEGYI